MANKKIRNAQSLEWNGIKFRSRLEVTIYKAILECAEIDTNIKDIKYEPCKYTIWKGYKPKLPFYIRDKKTGTLKNDTTKIIDITYKPDIIFYYRNCIILIEVKPQFMNDVFPYKRKLFRQYLEKTYEEGNTAFYPIYTQIGTRRELIELIRILKTKYNEDTV